MYLIIGLGNPEKKYLNTWHNVGFMCLDCLAKKLDVSFDKSECRAMTAHARFNGEKVILAKPLTYMNLSGEAVQELVHKYKIEKGKLAVVYDDVDLTLGSVRIRKSGSAGTHNGMKNIVQMLSTTDFARVRVGIGKDTPMELIDYVLSQVQDCDRETLEAALDNAANALYEFANGSDLDSVMQKHNIK
ncbi:MAG: aminoacyl-tRNA hydrolase [Corallococcus sp.]|nr:aminoacyl-tRNA hydrolase [Corallococcus sp.]MCM1359513.1 aminoacyl-tRNA hydrolase [Corallococcus sp.]MCM1395105.1 aminoacyl-tRNA hydrolase [Corallococcus sp.]